MVYLSNWTVEERARIIVFSKLIQLLRWLSLKNSIGEDVEKLEPLYTVIDTVNCCSCYGKQYGVYSKIKFGTTVSSSSSTSEYILKSWHQDLKDICNITLRQYVCLQMSTSKSCLNLPTPQVFASIAARRKCLPEWSLEWQWRYFYPRHRNLQGEAERVMRN